jgi:leucyl-tRNA synthetase
MEATEKEELRAIDKWMLSRLQNYIKKATESMERLAVRKAIHTVLYELDQDLQWYQKRVKASGKGLSKSVMKEVLKAQIRMLAPFTPHICEELWEMMGGEDFVCLSDWPTAEENSINLKAEETETLIQNLLEDTLNILRATNIKPRKVYYYTSAQWKWKLYLKALENSTKEKLEQKNLIKEALKDEELKAKAKEVANFAAKILEEINRMPVERKHTLTQIGPINEKEALKEAKPFLENEIKAEITVYEEEEPDRYDPKNRATLAKPWRPAIYIE